MPAEKYIATPEDLPPDFGLIDGQKHPDSIVADCNWNAALDAALTVVETYKTHGAITAEIIKLKRKI